MAARLPAVIVRPILLEACLQNWAWDTQVEESRAPYLLEIILATREAAWYAAQLQRGLLGDEDDFNVWQVFELAALLTGAGIIDLRATLHHVFRREAAKGVDVGADALIDLDGLPAYRVIANGFAFDALSEDTDHIHYLLLDKIVKREGEFVTRRFTLELAEAEPHLAEYIGSKWKAWESWREDLNRGRQRSREKPDYAAIKAMIEAPGVAISDWGRHTDDATLLRLAEDTLVETDPRRLGKYLRQFWRRPFPLDPTRLIDLARQTNQPGNNANLAARALAAVSDARVRDLALEFIHKPGSERRALGLLAKNSAPDDAGIIKSLLERFDSLPVEDYHLVGSSAVKYFEAHPEADATASLILLYKNGPCGLCRGRVVELLHQRGQLSEEMYAECRFDSDEGTRNLARTGCRFPVLQAGTATTPTSGVPYMPELLS